MPKASRKPTKVEKYYKRGKEVVAAAEEAVAQTLTELGYTRSGA